MAKIDFTFDGILVGENMVSPKAKQFGNLHFEGGECDMEMAFTDGVAFSTERKVGTFAMRYPKLADLTEKQKKEIVEFTNREDITPFDVALKYGILTYKELTDEEYAKLLALLYLHGDYVAYTSKNFSVENFVKMGAHALAGEVGNAAEIWHLALSFIEE